MLRAQGIRKAFDGQTVLDDISLRVDTGEIVCLLGASGSGKTTLLRIFAGLETPDVGTVLLDDRDIQLTPVHQRPFGLMFQEFALFPHMTVAENITFGLRVARASATQKYERLTEMLELVGMSGYAERAVSDLSGGERQRVALARSLAPRPRLLMLDEPLGSLDAALRDRLVMELRAILKEIGLSALYVTHDQREAFAVADRIAVMHNGRIDQIDAPQALYHRPRTRHVAAFLGLKNFLPVHDYTNGEAVTPVGTFTGSANHTNTLLLHPGGLSLSEHGQFDGHISEATYLGSAYRLTVEHKSGHQATFDVAANPDFVPHIGDTVSVAVEAWAVMGVDE